MTRPLMTLLLALSLSTLGGCTPVEGDRCNPLLFSDECGSGRKCTVPPNCAVAYCCPVSGPATAASCQACPGPDDGGTTD